VNQAADRPVIRFLGYLYTFAFLVMGAILGYEVGNRYIAWQGEFGSKPWALPPQVQQLSRGLIILLAMIIFTWGSVISFRSLISLGKELDRLPAENKVSAAIGVVVGLLITALLAPFLLSVKGVGWLLALIVGLVCVYLSVHGMMSMRSEVRGMLPTVRGDADRDPLQGAKLLDTNIIIDGRIAEILRTGFLDGTVCVPRFVLDELQLIADSSDPLKRNRGRRGLEILQQLQRDGSITVMQEDRPLGGRAGDPVDKKLTQLAAALGGSIVTNDHNLAQVAKLQGLRVLNVNELASSLRPVVLPGEELEVQVVKEGKEPGQGIAYLDDGTMVVIERGRPYIGQRLAVTVKQLVQTVNGKIIFSQPREMADDEATAIGQNVYAYSSRRPRRKVSERPQQAAVTAAGAGGDPLDADGD
jgi:uncharacterized protein YacL